MNRLFTCGMSLTTNLVHKSYSDQFGNSQRSLLSPTGCVKSIPPNTESSMQYGYDENDNNNMSNETECETNYSLNTLPNHHEDHIAGKGNNSLQHYFIDPEDEEFCKEFSSYYRKLATKTVRIQHEQQHEH